MATLKREAQVLPIRSPADVVLVRQAVRKTAALLDFSLVDQTKVVTAASELARNALDHGGGGRAQLDLLEEGGRCGLRMIFEDSGPGIPDIDRALHEGYSTGSGLGLGLSGSKRLLNLLEIHSKPGEGTRVIAIKWK